MNDTTPLSCPSCGKPLPTEASHGLCPRCVLQGVIADSPPPVDETLESVRAQFPELEIHELIGVGGMGRVYRARDPLVDRIVALKILSPERALDPEWIERFTREARALARLNHPHIVQVHRFGSTPQPHLVMEYVDGVNLRQAMEAGGLSAREALVIVPKLCDALHYAHEHGVLHRDIKPENILIDSEGRVKIVDFGLAKLRDEGVLHFTLTQSGAKLGTLAYMAPEQVENPSDVDHRADLYSLGVVFYEMLTGELPLGRFPSPSEANGTDPRLDAVVLRTLEKKREKRFPDAGAMRTEIESAATGPVPVKAENWNELNYEYRSPIEWRGWPLLHVAFGKDEATGKMKHARGIVAIGGIATGGLALGNVARGIVSFGVLSVGVISGGVLSIGLLTFGVVGLALLCATGVISLAPYSFGVTTLGYVSAGVKAYGLHTADIDGPISSVAAAVADRWQPILMSLQSWSMAIGISSLMLCSAFAAWKVSNKRIVALHLALSLMGPYLFVATRGANHPTSFLELLKKQEMVEQAKEKEATETAARERRERSNATANSWISEASRTDDPAAKEAAIRRIHEAIESDDPERILSGSRAFTALHPVKMDRSPFRDSFRYHVKNDALDWEVRGWTIDGLFMTDFEASDVQAILEMVETAPVEHLGRIAGALIAASKQDLTGEYSKPMLRILERTFAQDREQPQSKRPWDTREVLRIIWGARVSTEIESLLVEWSLLDADEYRQINVSSRGYNVFYFAVSVIANKSTISIKRLLELAQNPDTTNIAGRCFWGMLDSIENPEDQKLVAKSVIEILEERNDSYLWRQGLDLLARYATTDHLPALRELATREALQDERRKSLEAVIARLSP
jgi:predicted Ser/Thr protein kinase